MGLDSRCVLIYFSFSLIPLLPLIFLQRVFLLAAVLYIQSLYPHPAHARRDESDSLLRCRFLPVIHVEDEDFSAFGVCSCGKYEAYGFRNGHEVTDDVRMGYGYRTAFFNLTFEEWDYGAVASEYVSETYCDVFCSWNKFLLADLMHDAILFFAVCVKHWHLVCFSFFDHSVKRLDDHFADTLAGSHDVCWVYRFVCTDQYNRWQPLIMAA